MLQPYRWLRKWSVYCIIRAFHDSISSTYNARHCWLRNWSVWYIILVYNILPFYKTITLITQLIFLIIMCVLYYSPFCSRINGYWQFISMVPLHLWIKLMFTATQMLSMTDYMPFGYIIAGCIPDILIGLPNNAWSLNTPTCQYK